jgi:dsRNA-specific ribonuclease
MKGFIQWLLNTKATGKEFKKVKIEGKETDMAKGRSERLKEAREAKEALKRTGNKNTGD